MPISSLRKLGANSGTLPYYAQRAVLSQNIVFGRDIDQHLGQLALYNLDSLIFSILAISKSIGRFVLQSYRKRASLPWFTFNFNFTPVLLDNLLGSG